MSQSFYDRILVGGFCAFKTDLKLLAEVFSEWQNNVVLSSVPDKVVIEKLSGAPSQLLDIINPLVSPVITKWLFLEIGNGWILAVDNGRGGTDAGIAPILSRKCECLAIRVLSVLHTFNAKNGSGRYGAEIFESYLNGDETRVIYCANDGGKWKFGQSGVPYSIEDVSRYSQKPIRERFTQKELQVILQHLDVHADRLRENTTSHTVGFLVTRIGPAFGEYKEYSERFGED
ncbi:hypothetical protein NWF24_05880 [Variovorax paradoxus]|uniref:hypothetical protein n=1 Tax=Variovorax paradoxus TaxID=34073 RepID=UPI0021AD4A4E|nr:hypothetical protein [Variovorax paradoxus]UVH58936.1 hypothetical protein NWF24_05880 [Variovorax paradoxus]